jgi:hypothetical protein
LHAAGLEAGGAHHHGFGAAFGKRADSLKVGVEAALGDIVGMADVAAHHGSFPANRTHLGHDGILLLDKRFKLKFLPLFLNRIKSFVKKSGT